MKKLPLSILILLTLSSSAFAIIGEPESQIEKALGKPLKVWSSDGKTYAFGPYNLTVGYVDGVSESEFFCKSNVTPITHGEIVRLLNLNAAKGMIWDSQADQGPVHSWRSLDHKSRFAVYDERRRVLRIYSGKLSATRGLLPRKAPARKLYSNEI